MLYWALATISLLVLMFRACKVGYYLFAFLRGWLGYHLSALLLDAMG